MKRLIWNFIIALTIGSCQPYTPPQEFSSSALESKLVTLEGEPITLKTILNQYEGKTILIDVWASWCGDCIKTMPQLKRLQSEHKEVVFVFLSVDRTKDQWKRGINKYAISGDHYFIPNGMKSSLGKSISLDWIPRYMVIGPDGKIRHYKAINASDINLIKSLK